MATALWRWLPGSTEWGQGSFTATNGAMDYVQTGELEIFRMVAEGLGVAVGMAECAVALYEAQAQRHGAPTGRRRFYPTGWSRR